MESANHPSFRFRNPRAERLRAQGMIGLGRSGKGSAEVLRRAELAYKRLFVESDYRSSLRRHLRQRSQGGRTPLWAWSGTLVAGAGFVAALTGPDIAIGVCATVLVLALPILFAQIHNRRIAATQEAMDVARDFDAFLSARAHRIPVEIRLKLERLGEDLSVLLSDLRERDRLVLDGDDVRFVRIIVSEHLVNVIDPYLALRQPTALHETLMSTQVDRLHREVRGLLAKVESARAQRLVQGARFLERKLGS